MVVDPRPPGNDSHQPGLLRREERDALSGRTRSPGLALGTAPVPVGSGLRLIEDRPHADSGRA